MREDTRWGYRLKGENLREAILRCFLKDVTDGSYMERVQINWCKMTGELREMFAGFVDFRFRFRFICCFTSRSTARVILRRVVYRWRKPVHTAL